MKSPTTKDQRPSGIRRLLSVLRRISPRKVATALALLVSGDLRTIRRRWAAQPAPRPKQTLDLSIRPPAPMPPPVSADAPAREWEPIAFHPSPDPAVAVIVAARDGWNMTHACLASLAAAEPDLAYEVYLADDHSGDDTRFAGRWISGVTIVRSDRQDGLPAACDAAGRLVRAPYLCILSGTPQVQSGAISRLVELLRRRPEAGLAGNRVVGADGRLCEAGSRVTAEGTIEPHGLHQDPCLSEYTFVRDCGGFTGDCIALPTTVWERIGGFRGDYASFAYEVHDVACRVRALGRRVLYQPASIVVRLSGSVATSPMGPPAIGGGEASRRFVERWPADADGRSHPTGGASRVDDGDHRRKTVVVIDHHVPTPDRDAGSRTIFQYLALAAEIGYDVKFVPADFEFMPPYRELLEQEGIEVLAGDTFEREWRGWFRDRADDIRAVLFCRPQVAERFVDVVSSSCPRARRAYYGHDLHWVREERAHALTGDGSAAARAREWKRRECAVIGKMHCNMSISADESRLVAELLPDRDHVVFPVFYWNDLEGLQVAPEDRSGFLFVGGFAHTPNVDGLIWFLDEVWPTIRARLPDAAIHVAGSNAPPTLLARRDPGLVFHGFVDDSRLADLYRGCRVAVVPLRYGAGVKGKTVEAMRHGLPVVSTGIGIEGLPELPPDLRGYDDAACFASAALAVHADRDRWMRQVEDQFDYVRSRFSKDRAAACLRLALEGST